MFADDCTIRVFSAFANDVLTNPERFPKESRTMSFGLLAEICAPDFVLLCEKVLEFFGFQASYSYLCGRCLIF